MDSGRQQEMDSTNHDRGRGGGWRRLVWRSLAALAVVVLLLMIGFTIMNSLTQAEIEGARRSLRAFGTWWMFVRLGFIAGLIIYWTEINTWLAWRNGWSEAHLARVLAGRWVTLATLAFVELFLIQRIHEPLTDRWFQ